MRFTGACNFEETAMEIGGISAMLDLTRERRPVHRLLEERGGASLDFLAGLLKRGIVGIETVRFRGEPRETFASIRMADPALRNAPPFRDGAVGSRLDLRA